MRHLIAGQNLGDISLHSYDPTGVLYETWTLEQARVISYWVMDDSESGIPTVQLAFSFLAIQTTFYEDGVESGGGASRLDVSGETIVASGGGTGPENATGGKHLLEVTGDHALAVDLYSWAISAPFDFNVRLHGDAQPELFYVQTTVTNAGGLFVELAAGIDLGDITLRSYDSAGDLYETWTLEHARVISYSVMDDSESGVPTVQLAFSFLAIQTTFYEDGVQSGGGASLTGCLR